MSELLVRLGVKKLTIWDADEVSGHNLGNQMFEDAQVGKPKTDAIEEILKRINPELEVVKKGFCEVSDKLSGYIFLCIDNIDVRRELCKKWKMNPNILFVQDVRMGLTTGMLYAADWNVLEHKNDLINSMNYTHEEALAETPVSACGLTLSVVITPRILAALTVSNWIHFINTKEFKHFATIDGYTFDLLSYKAK